MLTLGGWGEFDRWVGSLVGVGHHSLLFRAQQCSVFHRYHIINGFSLSEECKMLFLESFGWGTRGSCLSVSSSLLGCLIFPSRCMSSRRERLFMSWFWFHHSFLQSTFFYLWSLNPYCSVLTYHFHYISFLIHSCNRDWLCLRYSSTVVFWFFWLISRSLINQPSGGFRIRRWGGGGELSW